MTITPVALWGPTQLDITVAPLYTSPLNGIAVIKRAVFTNTSTDPQTITVYVVRNGDSPDATNIVIDARAISAGDTDLAPELANLVLGGGDSVQALASLNAVVNATASGYRQ